MAQQPKLAISPDESPDVWNRLAERLGPADGLFELGSLASLLRLGPVRDLGSLKTLLTGYQTKVLLTLELPAIHAAYRHAIRNQVRELVTLDTQFNGGAELDGFTAASRRLGRHHLKRLRPLTDLRLVQRYLNAVEAGQANGWHTMVYGISLALYSVPLRQGLLGYARQSTANFISTAAATLRLSAGRCRQLTEEFVAELPKAVEQLLAQPAPD
jgi:urease accessory protein UreF